MCRHFREDYGLCTRVARFHNVYGPHGTWDGGREKAPAALCRKVIAAKLSGQHEIEVWGTGEQARSYMYVDDVVKGIQLIAASSILEPINLGSAELVSVDQLVDLIEEIAGIKLTRRYNLTAPRGVNGRNSDNTRIKQYLDWEPGIPLRVGLAKTYAWIYEQYVAREKRLQAAH
jgi:nucleoside-diphosphate-sugar epimerase